VGYLDDVNASIETAFKNNSFAKFDSLIKRVLTKYSLKEKGAKVFNKNTNDKEYSCMLVTSNNSMETELVEVLDDFADKSKIEQFRDGSPLTLRMDGYSVSLRKAGTKGSTKFLYSAKKVD
jgi:hypothetical protein